MSSIKGSIAITFADQLFSLLPDRAIWWPARSALVVSDVHLGKSAAFRLTGVPVPSGATAKDLTRLTALLEQTDARQLIVLGDFLHSRAGRQAEVLEAITTWRRAHADLPITLVRGNHDRSAGKVPADWNIQETEEPFLQEGVCLVHDPKRATDCHSLAGHVHPIVSVQDFDRSSISLPCFVVDERSIILPAFGTFTGGHRMHRLPGRAIYALAGDRVILLPEIG
jgi:uncharacterized protein